MKFIKNKYKKASGDILLAGFFIILVIFVIFLFGKIHSINLYSNYNINKYKIEANNLFQVKDILTSCYGYPIKIDSSSKFCSELKDVDFSIEVIENGLCHKKEITLNGEKTMNAQNLIIPIIDNETKFTCIGNLILYYDENIRE